MTKYKAVFFDLDHTLWDYETNSKETLIDLHKAYDLNNYAGFSVSKFIETFHKVNHKLWDNYNRGVIDRAYIKNYRFKKILEKAHVNDDALALELSKQYISTCQQKKNLMPFTFETLDYLSEKYHLYILTNGFNDVQETKLSNTGLASYFKGIVTSETCGFRKPAKQIFDHTIHLARSVTDEVIMIGDNLSTDVNGALNAGIDAVFYNPEKMAHKERPSYEISCLSELSSIL